VDEEKWIAVRQQREELLDVVAVERPNGRLVHCVPLSVLGVRPKSAGVICASVSLRASPPARRLTAATWRKNSRMGLAGAPHHFSPAGMSVMTPAAAATCAPAPIVRCPAMPA